jgi:hypothetical protein
MPLKTPARRGCILAFGLACTTAQPGWSGQSLVPATANRPSWSTNQAGPPVAEERSTAAIPPPRSVPTWSAVPAASEAVPGWMWLPTGAGPAPGWSPPTPPVINTPPLWRGS